MYEIQLNDIGTEIIITVKNKDGDIVDLSSATDFKIHCLPPDDGDIRVFEASVYSDGTDGIIHYITQEADFDIIGTWEIQVLIYFGSSLFHSVVDKIKVLRNIGG